MLAAMLRQLVSFSARRALIVVFCAVILLAGSLFVTVKKLGVTTDTDEMFARSLPWRQHNDVINRLFPGNDDLMVAVIKARIPEEGQATARALAQILSAQHDKFRFVRLPDDDPYLRQHGLLYLEPAALESLLNNIVAAQPFMGTLAADPSARGLFNALGMIGQGLAHGETLPGNMTPQLNGFATALQGAAEGHPTNLSWQRLLTPGTADMTGQYQFVVTKPVLKYNNLQPGGEASDAIHEAVANLPFVKSGDVSVMITGPVQLSDEEFATVAQGMGIGLITSLILVACWLFFAVRSPRVIIPILITLIYGLLITTGFAAIAVGRLNLISVAFAILFVGIAVDFAIQFSVRFRAQEVASTEGNMRVTALGATGFETGHQILVAALATAAGFLAFVPTNFVGVAQLGLIAGIGMLIAFFCTMTILPALLALCRARAGVTETGLQNMAGCDRFLRRYRKSVMSGFAILAVIGMVLLPRLYFDADPLHTKNPHTEGMRALHALQDDPRTSLYSGALVAPNLQIAGEWVKAFDALPIVDSVMWLGMFLPTQQDQKLAMIRDTAAIMLPTLVGVTPLPPPGAVDLREAARQAAENLSIVLKEKRPDDDPLLRIQKALTRLATAPDTTLLESNDALTRFLPEQLQTLQSSLQADEVTLDNLPKTLAENYVTPDGKALLTIQPKSRITSNEALYRFVEDMQRVNKDVAGTAVEVVGSAQTMIHAFTDAAIYAVIMIALILFVILRRLLDVALVLAPLLLSALLTVIIVVTVPITLNYANIIALPLLLGVGVSFNIYFVMNWREGVKSPLASPTARAVLFSALTTGTAFGSLAASQHPGTASMGILLLLSLACTLLATLILVPALLPQRAIDD